MTARLVLASGSAIRAKLMSQAGLAFTVTRPSVDEPQLKRQFADLSPLELAHALAAAKARSVSQIEHDAVVIGADQVLNFDGKAYDKPATSEIAREQLRQMRGKIHRLETALCCCSADKVVWTYDTHAELAMRDFSDAFLDDYLAAGGGDVVTSVGGYKLEEQGIQLFSRIEGDYFGVLGLPLLPLLEFLRAEGLVAT